MTEKNEVANNVKYVRKTVSDIGIGAYLLMHGYKIVGRKGSTVYFDVREDDASEFDKLAFDYLSSPYHEFDANIMSLKKMGDYLPRENR